MAATPLPVLVVGESGVGKELVARAVHTMSGRRGSLVDINCPAIPESTLENELFGCTRGAFTGAEDRPGLIAGADRGTLFLDEIGDLPKGLQAKLLRFLETGTYRRLGSHAVDRVDTRVVSATNARLEEQVDSGAFRRDLYHRIAGVVLSIPPLRERKEDIDILARHFVALIAERQGRTPPAIDAALVDALAAHDWPGNVRELRHVVECIAWSHPDARILTVEALPDHLDVGSAGAREMLDAPAIRRAIAASSGRIAGAARRLGVSRQRLYRRAEALGLDLAEARRA
jgi:transcriptional regulator with PAS, ATPase and Fis domain